MNDLNPKISIITVCYNSEKTIKDTIESVINQSYPNIEYIIIDGVSKDNTLGVIEPYKEKIARVVSEPDKGMYDAINKGIVLANGNYIGILNADDFYIDNHVIEKVVELLKTTGAQSLYADLYYVEYEKTDKVVRYWKSGNYKRKKFLTGWMPPHPTFFIEKSAYEKYGAFNLKLKSAADYELMLRMLYKYDISIAYLKEVAVKMRVGGMSNASLKNRIKANREDKKAWLINGLKPAPYTFISKPLRKLTQYLLK